MNTFFKIDNWLWRHFDRYIMVSLRWISYVMIFVGLVKFDAMWLLAAALLWHAWAVVNQTGTMQQSIGLYKELLEAELEGKKDRNDKAKA